MIKICNLKNEKICFDYDVKVDRSSVLGNIFVMHSESERDAVCDKYQVYFDKQVASNNNAFLSELRRLYRIHQRYGKLRLFCWCYPKRCHAETIRNFLNKYI